MTTNQFNDIQVVIDVKKVMPTVGLGNPIIFVKGEEQKLEKFEDLSEVEGKYTTDTTVGKMLETAFNQKNVPQFVLVATYVSGVEGGSEGIVKAYKEYANQPFHFILIADGAKGEALAISNIIEEEDFRFLAVQVEKSTELAEFKENKRTIGFVHANKKERLDMAVIANTANLEVGSVTWKFRNKLKGVTAQEYTVSEFNEINKANGIAYVIKNGIPQTSEGKTIGGDYIDMLHGIDWVKSNIEKGLQQAFIDNEKVPYNAQGIGLLKAKVTEVLAKAANNGIIDTDDETGLARFTVTSEPRANIRKDNYKNRHYDGIHFEYVPSNAIHSVKVTGSILDI